MRILAINTATEACSVALWTGRKCLVYFEKCARDHTQHILPLIKKIMQQGNTALTDLDALAFSRGPGSFTGVRIGIGIIQGLALGANLPVIGISTLVTMAQGAFRQSGATRVLAAINARIGEIYWGEYTRNEQGIWHGEETEAVYKLEEANSRMKTLSNRWTMVGTGWKAFSNIAHDSSLTLIDGNVLLPAARDMLPIACQLLEAGKAVSVEHAELVYFRNEVAWKKLPVRNNS